MKSLWVIGEFEEGTLSESFSEAIGCFDRIRSNTFLETSLVFAGSDLVRRYGAFNSLGQQKIILIESAVLASNEARLVAKDVSNIALQRMPKVIACMNTQWGQELAAYIAGSLVWPLVTDIIGCDADGEDIIVQRLAFGGQHKNFIRLPENAVITLHPHTFTPIKPSGVTTSIEKLVSSFTLPMFHKSIERIEPLASEGPSIIDAQIIISGGRGMGSPANFELIKKLATKLGAAYGASRAVVDAGWIEPSHQVGLTGKVVSPRLYIACGISGADQHLAGMRTSDIIVAINRDPDAAIFKYASYGIVGDCIETITALLELLE